MIKEVIFMTINVIVTIISMLGAIKSIKYYNKSRNLTEYAGLNKALVEAERMQNELVELLAVVNVTNKGIRGVNKNITLCDIGKKLSKSYNSIWTCIPVGLSADFKSIENGFGIQEYLDEMISGKLLLHDETIDLGRVKQFQTVINEAILLFKQKLDETQEKLK